MRIFTILKKLCTKTKVDYIVSQGISGIWFYRKWASGYCELYGCGTATARYVQTWNGMYHCTVDVIFRFRLVKDGCFTIRKLKPDLVCRQINLEQNGIQQLKKYS